MATDCVEVNLTELIDGILRDLLIAGVPVRPEHIASTIAEVFFRGFKPKVGRDYERQVANLVRERMTALRLEYGTVFQS